MHVRCTMYKAQYKMYGVFLCVNKLKAEPFFQNKLLYNAGTMYYVQCTIQNVWSISLCRINWRPSLSSKTRYYTMHVRRSTYNAQYKMYGILNCVVKAEGRAFFQNKLLYNACTMYHVQCTIQNVLNTSLCSISWRLRLFPKQATIQCMYEIPCAMHNTKCMEYFFV